MMRCSRILMSSASFLSERIIRPFFGVGYSNSKTDNGLRNNRAPPSGGTESIEGQPSDGTQVPVKSKRQSSVKVQRSTVSSLGVAFACHTSVRSSTNSAGCK